MLESSESEELDPPPPALNNLFQLSYLDALQSSLYLDQIVKVRGGRIKFGCPTWTLKCALIHGADLEDFTRDSHACQPPGKDILLLTAERAKPKHRALLLCCSLRNILTAYGVL